MLSMLRHLFNLGTRGNPEWPDELCRQAQPSHQRAEHVSAAAILRRISQLRPDYARYHSGAAAAHINEFNSHELVSRP